MIVNGDLTFAQYGIIDSSLMTIPERWTIVPGYQSAATVLIPPDVTNAILNPVLGYYGPTTYSMQVSGINANNQWTVNAQVVVPEGSPVSVVTFLWNIGCMLPTSTQIYPLGRLTVGFYRESDTLGDVYGNNFVSPDLATSTFDKKFASAIARRGVESKESAFLKKLMSNPRLLSYLQSGPDEREEYAFDPDDADPYESKEPVSFSSVPRLTQKVIAAQSVLSELRTGRPPPPMSARSPERKL